MANQIKIQQVKGVAGSSQHQRRVLRALGLRHREHTVVHDDTPQIRGMVNKVYHMVKVTNG
ncbi:MAG: 50S ribosomal protein L30 [candidate division Zixibacteria bacterium]|nr:50S ribosomal protein L30 [candidate division Zixibacteria bacterium]